VAPGGGIHARIAIIGSGFGGLGAAIRLKREILCSEAAAVIS
jgi:cation diffusion facilitator CzcD-associated flavoprotein CzcO